MRSTVEPPDDIARHPDPGREVLERLAIEGYRSGALTHFQAGQLFGLSRFEFDALFQDIMRLYESYLKVRRELASQAADEQTSQDH